MAVRFAAVGVAVVLVLPVSGAYAEEHPPGPAPASTSGPAAIPGDAEEDELLPGVGAPDMPEGPYASAASPAESLAGRPAGEGRERPGRAPEKSADPGEGEGEETGEEAAGEVSPSGSASPSGSPRGTLSPSASASTSASASATPRKSYAPKPWDVHEQALEDPAHEPAASPPDPPPGGAHEGSEQVVAQSDPLGVHVLPLGAGLTLVGLGLGFLGLRLRRG
ncbi:hypothetical protein [Streptomyces flavidovirens]|uniref:Secreted protein n=1 Tax=Streptomyces flavidovirens TaxID=67298 RepID=A0ABW6RDU3_9ACTN